MAKSAAKAKKASDSKRGKAAPDRPEAGAEGDPEARTGTAYWLFKTEPDAHSWETQKARGRKGEPWDGVRNFVARNNMKAMRVGDLGFFYHTGDEKRIVGIVEVCAPAHPDPKDTAGIWQCVDVRAVCDVPEPVTLAAVRANPKLAGMALVKTARLSVQPVTAQEWKEVCRMGGVDPARMQAGK